MWITSSLKAAKAPVNIALGNFDGVHLGHQRVMAQVLSGLSTQLDVGAENRVIKKFSDRSIEALHSGVIASGYSHLPRLASSGNSESASDFSADFSKVAVELPIGKPIPNPGIFNTVVTFSPHPQEYFSGISRLLLTPVAEKTWWLSQLGIHQLVMLPFDRAMAGLSPENFVEKILIEGLQAKRISVGSDFRFGKGRRGDADGLQVIAQRHGVPVVQVPLMFEQGDRISSSRIRTALETGQPQQATQLLGRPYTLTGRVVQGKQLGRTIGFPTANLQIPTKKYLPCHGVYSVYVYGIQPEPLRGVMNIGNRPTVNGQTLSLEVHLLDWSGDLYGQLLTVSLESFVRPEQKFDSLEKLKAQIVTDCDVATAALS